LQKDKNYCIEFFVNLSNYSKYSIDRIGAVFTSDSLLSNDWLPLPDGPGIKNQKGNIITDTALWTLMPGIYVAGGGEKFITIGCFYEDDSISIDTVNPSGNQPYAYYYVDDVYVREMDSIPSSIFAGNVKIICKGETAELGSPLQPGYAYHWQGPGLFDTISAEITVSPQQTTDYVLTITDTLPKPYSCQPTKNDTVTVMIADCDSLRYNAWLPNIFSPNGDGNNDVLYVRGNNITSMQMAIYDRWGEKVFESTELSYGWGGNYNGKPLNPDVFVYMSKVVYEDGTERELKGNVTLVR